MQGQEHAELFAIAFLLQALSDLVGNGASLLRNRLNECESWLLKCGALNQLLFA